MTDAPSPTPPDDHGSPHPGASPGSSGRSDRSGPGGDDDVGFEATARLMGRYHWVESRLFEIVGAWVPEVDELEVKLALAEQAHHFAWHAELWRERLPRVAHLDPGALTAAPGPSLVAVFDALADPLVDGRPGPPAGAGNERVATRARVVGLYRVVLPRLVAAYTAHEAVTSPVADGPVRRALGLILRDELEDWRQGEVLAGALTSSVATAREAAAWQAELDVRLVEAGGLVGSAPSADTGGGEGPG